MEIEGNPLGEYDIKSYGCNEYWLQESDFKMILNKHNLLTRLKSKLKGYG